MAATLGGGIVIVAVGNLPESATMAREEASELREMLNHEAKENGLSPDIRVDMDGDAAQGILQMAEDEGADLIVMATHGRSGLSDMAQGSVARDVVRDGRLPVLLVRPKQ